MGIDVFLKLLKLQNKHFKYVVNEFKKKNKWAQYELHTLKWSSIKYILKWNIIEISFVGLLIIKNQIFSVFAFIFAFILWKMGKHFFKINFHWENWKSKVRPFLPREIEVRLARTLVSRTCSSNSLTFKNSSVKMTASLWHLNVQHPYVR